MSIPYIDQTTDHQPLEWLGGSILSILLDAQHSGGHLTMLRYPGEIDIDPVWAVEAAFDDRALVARDPASRTGEAICVIGFSTGAGMVLVVVLLPEDHPPTGSWHVVTAWPANRRLRNAYVVNDEEEGMTWLSPTVSFRRKFPLKPSA